ncbi:hypothetical protein MTO98_23605 [Mucilaginibacter sp. SMC90]|uniref:hypothetical protein n=1 Tax=Mucilaginibacter sp. SMC90 TaxID=2929803 RepID=UPI001FB4A59A|nr:hypothetical protein [Mucilaginibacter sp. SMC90]UOE47396.1 hypothetical protein MTO98_23605 [Mucilaginibacter sp. SMC90]
MKIGVFFVHPSYLSGQSESLLKTFLFFDKIYIASLPIRDPKVILDAELQVIDVVRSRMSEIDNLTEAGFISNFSEIFPNGIPDHIQIQSAFKEELAVFNNNFKNKMPVGSNIDQASPQGQAIFDELFQRMSRLMAVSLNIHRPNDEHIPIINSAFFDSAFPAQQKSLVVNTIFKKFPTIKDDTSIDAIKEFKADKEAIDNLYTLRDYINNIAREQLTISEVEDRIDYFLNQYEKSLELHKFRYNYTTFESVIKMTADVAENLVKFQFSKAFEGYLSFKNQHVDLLMEERKLQGRELAYISQVKETFS